jgi:hypothetical protein
LTLSEFDLEFHHVAGSKLAAPNVLSCHPDHFTNIEPDPTTTLLPDSLFIKLIGTKLFSAQARPSSLKDPIFLAAQQALDGISAPPMRSALKDWRIDDNLLFYKNRAYVPPDL